MLSGWKRNLLIAFVLVGVAVAAVWLNRTAGRRALERRKAELRANGEQLTYAEWSGGKRETNGTARSQTIFSLASQLPHVGNFPLGPVNEMMSLETPGRARVVWRRTELPAVASRGSNVVALSWSEAAEEIADAGETLRLLRAELASPPLDMGWDYDSDPLGAPRINYVALRNGAQWLAGATLVALHHGDTTNALEHWRTLFALARMHAREPTLVSQMIRVAIGGLGLSAAWEMLQTPGLTEEQLAAMQSELLCVDFARTVANASESERALGLALFAEFRSNPSHNFNVVQSTKSVAGLGDQIYWSGWRGGFADADELFYLDQFQMTIEA
ncbi:MAG: hypothetical protein HY301_02795, partial [Verrucomicrobia bacterium]|nr:hypothetical protein [Verrucomicrobiota bacterium]